MKAERDPFDIDLGLDRALDSFPPIGIPDVKKGTPEEVIERSKPRGKSEDERNASLARSLNAKPSKRGADIVGKDFIVEGKSALTSKSVLDRLKGQIDGYVRGGQNRIIVVIFDDARQDLLDELRSFCGQYWNTSISIKVKGSIIKGGPR